MSYEKATLWLIGLAGESKENPDGTSRQEELERCRYGEPVVLVREPENRYDKMAVRVDSIRGVTIGYIPRDCRFIAETIDRDVPVRGIINDVTGGYGRKHHLGCVVRIRTGGKNPDRPIPRVEEKSRKTSNAAGCAGTASVLILCFAGALYLF